MKTILFVNSACNARCKHCYIECAGNKNPKEALMMTEVLQNYGHEISIAGSEVLLNPKYLELYKQAKQTYLLTNGIILDGNKSLYALLKQYGIEELVFSAHFGIRKKIKSVSENLVTRVIKESKERGFRIKLFTLITSENHDSMARICEKAVDLGVDVFQPIRFVSAGKGREIQQLSLTPEQLRNFFLQTEEVRKTYPKSTMEIILHGNFGPRPGSKGEELAKENKYCPAGKEMIVIDPQNNIYGCPFLMQEKNRIGIYKNKKVVIENDLLDGQRNTCLAHLIT